MDFDDFKEKVVDPDVILGVIIILIVLLVPALCIYSYYSTRIIETASIDTTAVITDIYHRDAYTTSSVSTDSKGRQHIRYVRHPERNVFTFDTYWENEHVVVEESVTHDDYVTYSKNDEIQICLTKEWRADDSVTYSIEILK